MIGDVVYVTTLHNKTFYNSDTDVFTELLQTLDNPYGAYNINFKLYDNWEFMKNNDFYSHEYKPNVGDGKADQIFIINRDISKDGVAAEKTLAYVNFTSNDGVVVSKYCGSRVFGFKNAITPGAVGGPAHEYCHYLLGGTQTTGHFDGYNFLPTQTRNRGRINQFALMCAVNAGWMSAYERYRLGWLTPYVVSSNITSKVLKDTHIENEAILIPLRDPYKGSWKEFYLIENYHTQRDYANANPFLVDQVFGDPITHGLLVFHIEDQDYTLPCATKINILCADGKWTWKLLQGASTPSDRSDDLIGKDQPARYGNFDERNFITINVGGINYNDYVCLDHHPAYPGSKYNRNDFLGDFADFFREEYNDVLTRYSNPGTYTIGGTAKDVGFEITGYNSTTKEYILSLQVTPTSVTSLKPSKPQNLLMSVTTDRHPKLTWDKNLEPDMTQYKVYRSTNASTGYTQIGTAVHNPFLQTITYIDYTIDVPLNGHQAGDIKYYRVTAADNQTLESVKSDYVQVMSDEYSEEKINSGLLNNEVPKEYSLRNNYPNPFNPSTIIKFQIPENSFTSLIVYNALGEQVAELVNDFLGKGQYSVQFQASDLPSGLYLYKLQSGRFTDVKKMLLTK